MDSDNELPHSTPTHHLTAETPCSAYKQSESSEDSDNDTIRSESSTDKLNEFLLRRDISPVRSKLKAPWHFTKESTKRHHLYSKRQRSMTSLRADPDYSSSDCQTSWSSDFLVDFSEPQGEKGTCDRKAATIKSHMAEYLNSGREIETAAQMKEAIESSRGVRGISVKVCSPPDVSSTKSFKWEKVSFVSNLYYGQEACHRV